MYVWNHVWCTAVRCTLVYMYALYDFMYSRLYYFFVVFVFRMLLCVTCGWSVIFSRFLLSLWFTVVYVGLFELLSYCSTNFIFFRFEVNYSRGMFIYCHLHSHIPCLASHQSNSYPQIVFHHQQLFNAYKLLISTWIIHGYEDKKKLDRPDEVVNRI